MSVKVRAAIAAACAVLAAVCVLVYAAGVRGEASDERREALERYGGEAVKVCVATRQISAGETFSERNVTVLDWLVDLLPEGALADPDELMGRTASCAIAQNTPLARVHVDAGDNPLAVPEGLVAVSVPCANESAVGGALSAGCVVDAYVVGDGAARPVCQGVQVLQTSSQGTLASLSWIILAVAPDQVEAVVAASGTQRLYFVLPSDAEMQRRLQERASGAEAAVVDGLMEAYGTPQAAEQSAQGQGV